MVILSGKVSEVGDIISYPLLPYITNSPNLLMERIFIPSFFADVVINHFVDRKYTQRIAIHCKPKCVSFASAVDCLLFSRWHFFLRKMFVVGLYIHSNHPPLQVRAELNGQHLCLLRAKASLYPSIWHNLSSLERGGHCLSFDKYTHKHKYKDKGKRKLCLLRRESKSHPTHQSDTICHRPEYKIIFLLNDKDEPNLMRNWKANCKCSSFEFGAVDKSCQTKRGGGEDQIIF